jgi:hypothetical protein
VPPPASVSDEGVPRQTLVFPLTDDGVETTVSVETDVQPVDNVYVITVVPAEILVRKPEELPMVATAVLLLLHVPPPTTSDKLVVNPAHIDDSPLIGAFGFTSTLCVAIQPVGNEYVITAVPPATPVMMPVDEPAVATKVLLLLQVPPPASVRAVVAPPHTVVVPVIAAAAGFTVIFLIAVQPVSSV